MSRFERLGNEHQLDAFASGHDELDAWLRDAANTADRAGTARVYVWLDDESRVIGYFAILPHIIRRADVPPTTMPVASTSTSVFVRYQTTRTGWS